MRAQRVFHRAGHAAERREVYNAEPPYHWYLQYSSVLFVGIAAVAGFAYYWFVQRHKVGVLAEHSSTADEDETIPVG